MTDRVTRLNRRALRTYGARRRRVERAELNHQCAVHKHAHDAGVVREIQVKVAFYHDLHRALGEPSCPRCPRCLWLREAGRIDRKPEDPKAIRAQWNELLEVERQSYRGR